MRNIIKITSLLLVLIISISACRNDDDGNDAQEAILGTWLQVEPECSICDTIMFNEDGTFIQLGNLSTYTFISDDTIMVERGISLSSHKIAFANSNEELFIEQFEPIFFGIEPRANYVMNKIK